LKKFFIFKLNVIARESSQQHGLTTVFLFYFDDITHSSFSILYINLPAVKVSNDPLSSNQQHLSHNCNHSCEIPMLKSEEGDTLSTDGSILSFDIPFSTSSFEEDDKDEDWLDPFVREALLNDIDV